MKFLLLLLLVYATAAQANQDDDFLAARDAYLAGDVSKLASYASTLKNSPLEIYFAYYQLKLAMNKADTVEPAEIEAFLLRAKDTPLIDRMRAAWLKTLGKEGQWALFDREYPRLIASDTELTCYDLQSRIHTHPHTVLHKARQLWFSAKDLPDSCTVLFDAAIKAGVISPRDIRQRMRLALELGRVSLAKYLANRLKGKQAISARALGRAKRNPLRYLKRLKSQHFSSGKREVVLFALHQLARQSPDFAIARWHKISSKFNKADRQYFFSWIAYEAARKHDVRAIKWYRLAGKTPLHARQAAWRVRAALRVKKWHEVLISVKAMQAKQRNKPVWQYWRARALQATGQRTKARKIFISLKGRYDFYGQMAAEELKPTPVLSAIKTTYIPSAAAISTLLKKPGVQRTLALYRMDLRIDALHEWRWVIRGFNDHELLAAAEVARRNKMYDRAINTAERTVKTHNFSLRYLAPYRAAMRSHIEENSLEEAWVYGLMRQESRFVTSARSGVGATGLMQVMPATARWIAKKLGLKNYRNAMLHQLDTNITLGTYYMKNMLSSLDDSPVLASAAYNAGPSRARRWRANGPLEGAIYAETIPFTETRGYVKKVMSNTVYYAREFGAPTQTLKQRMGVIRGKLTADKVTKSQNKKGSM
ncbi:MAG: transglycosylase SLT domain-containing protein [Gallionella sp.]